MRYALLPLLTFLVASTADAEPGVTTRAQPVCRDAGELKEFVQAMSAGDVEWMGALKSCRISKPGIKMVVVEGAISIDGMSNVAKVRVFAAGTSALVYTILLPEQRS